MRTRRNLSEFSPVSDNDLHIESSIPVDALATAESAKRPKALGNRPAHMRTRDWFIRARTVRSLSLSRAVTLLSIYAANVRVALEGPSDLRCARARVSNILDTVGPTQLEQSADTFAARFLISILVTAELNLLRRLQSSRGPTKTPRATFCASLLSLAKIFLTHGTRPAFQSNITYIFCSLHSVHRN